MSQPSHPGILHQYAPRLVAFEFTSTSTTSSPKPHSLLFVGGLSDGLFTVPYVSTLAKCLESTDWSVFWLLLSSSYSGWGTSSLDKDGEEIAQCVRFVRDHKTAQCGAGGKVVVMGHSTGSQDVLHYLHSPNPFPHDDTFEKGLQHLTRPQVDGAIMQAPVSDREAVLNTMKGDNEARGAYDQLVDFARRQPFTGGKCESILPPHLVKMVGLADDVPVSSRRFLSLVSPESPERPADDDLFSSDLGDQRLRETFGAVGDRGLLRSSLLVLYSGSDDFAPAWIDKEHLMQRWKDAANEGGRNRWNENSGVILGASHNVKDQGQEDLVARVTRYLEEVEKA